MKLKRIILLLTAILLLAACAKVADAPEAQSEQTPAPTAEPIAIPKDQRGVELALKAETWGDCICVIPETFSVTEATETELVARAEDEAAADLIEVRYALVPYEEQWAFEAALQDPDTFEKKDGHEITAGCSGTYLWHSDSVVCCASALYLENEVCMVVGKALSEEGIDEFDSTVRRFVAIDARRKADAMGEGINPFFTCTGTEYGKFPIISPKERKAEALAFLNENRDALERAAKVALDTGEMTEIGYHLTGTGLHAIVGGPEPEFTEGAEQYLAITYPRAIDTTYDDPGILYVVVLIYTNNSLEQIGEWYRDELEPLGGDWYIETYFYAY